MAMFNNWFWTDYFPSTNLHELNLDWILSEIRKMEEEIDTFEKWVVEEIKKEMAEFRAEFNQKLVDFQKEMEEKIDTQFEEKMQEVNELLDAFEVKIENRLTEFETTIVEPIRRDVANLQETTQEHGELLTGLRRDVNVNSSSINRNRTDIDNLSSYSAYLNRKIEQNTENINTNKEGLHSLGLVVDETRQLMSEEHFANLQMRKNLETQMSSLGAYVDTNVSSLSSYVDKNIEDVKELIVVNTNSIISYIDKRDNDYNSSMIAYVDSKIGDIDLSSVMAYVDNSIHNLQEQSDIHTENITAINEELETVHDIATEALSDSQQFINFNNQKNMRNFARISIDGNDETGVIGDEYDLTLTPFKTLQAVLNKIYTERNSQNVFIILERSTTTPQLNITYLRNSTSIECVYNGVYSDPNSGINIDLGHLNLLNNVTISTMTNLQFRNGDGAYITNSAFSILGSTMYFHVNGNLNISSTIAFLNCSFTTPLNYRGSSIYATMANAEDTANGSVHFINSSIRSVTLNTQSINIQILKLDIYNCILYQTHFATAPRTLIGIYSSTIQPVATTSIAAYKNTVV